MIKVFARQEGVTGINMYALTTHMPKKTWSKNCYN